jgi:peptidyl-prolyl cis-trans isomerase B (cyclophilin B)
VGMASGGDPTKADSQFYVMLKPNKSLDNRYVVFGQVTSGMDVVAKIELGDRIKRATVR